MLNVTNTLTQAVADREMSVSETEKLSRFLKVQRFNVAEAGRKQQREKSRY